MNPTNYSVGIPVEIKVKPNPQNIIELLESDTSYRRDIYISRIENNTKINKFDEKLSSNRSIVNTKKHNIIINLDTKKDVYMCFVVDCTTSMNDYINDLTKNISNIINMINSKGNNINLSFIGYYDKDQNNNFIPPSVIDFTTDEIKFKKFLSSITTKNGIDHPEDVYSGLLAVSKLSWKSKISTNILFHICDAPGHGFNWYNKYSDRYPKINDNYDDIFEYLKNTNIDYYFGRLTFYTDKMIKDFQNMINIIEFDIKSPKQLLNTIIKTVAISQSKTINNIKIDNIKIDNSKIDNIKIDDIKIDDKAVKCDIIIFKQITKITDISSYMNLNPIKLKNYINFDKKHFSEGCMRYVHLGILYTGTTKNKIVVKRYKQDTDITFQIYKNMADIEMQIIAVYLANEYSKKSKSGIDISFIESKAVYQYNNDNAIVECFTIENYINHTNYVKFNNNGGWVNKTEKYTDILQGFSCWTKTITNGYMQLVDLQGIIDGNKVILTDPAIHCNTHLTRFGETNMGERGMTAFTNTHICTEHCKV